MTTARLLRFLSPKSVAVVGGGEALRVIRQCRKSGYEGRIWAVNPCGAQIEGVECLPSVDVLPEAPDAAFIAIPAHATIEAVAALRRIGAGGAVCYAAGFEEMGAEGAELQKRLCEAAGDLPVLGPNCYGYVNFLTGAALWPDQFGHAPARHGAAIITQSGNMGISLTMQRRGLPLALMATLGNQAQIGVEDFLEAAVECSWIDAVGMHFEGVRSLERFARAARALADRGKPVVALKAGRSETGARIALGHTASLSGEAALYDALFDRLGIAHAADIETFVETLKLETIAGSVCGSRVTSLSCSGGEASLMADLSQSTGLVFPALEERHRRRMQDALGERVLIDNPLDYHTYIWADRERLTECFSCMLGGGFDFAFFVVDFPRQDQCDLSMWEPVIDAILESARATGVSAGVVATLAENMPENIARRLAERGIVPFCGMRQALDAVDASRRAYRARNSEVHMPCFAGPHSLDSAAAVDESQGKELLREAGVPVPEGCVASTTGECLQAARRLGYPLVVKALSSELVHKSEAGALTLGIGDDAMLERESQRLLDAYGSVLVERMVVGAAVELIVGIDYDRQFGNFLMIGMGGVAAELFADRRILLLPTSAEEIRESIMSLKLSPLLTGYRGGEPGDVDAAVESVMALVNHPGLPESRIRSLEINPLLVMPKSREARTPGTCAVDAFVQVVAAR